MGKQGFVIWRVAVRRGGRKRKVKNGITYGKPVHHGINHLKPRIGHQNRAEMKIGRRDCGNLRVLGSYWVCQCGRYKYYEVIMGTPSTKPSDVIPRLTGYAAPCTSTASVAVSPHKGRNTAASGRGGVPVRPSAEVGGRRGRRETPYH